MRTFTLCLFLTGLIAFYGCDDGTGGPHPVEYFDVTGTWSLRKASVGYNDEPQNLLIDSDAFSYPPRFQWRFAADGQMYFGYPTNGSTSDSLSWQPMLEAGVYTFDPNTTRLTVPIDVISTATSSAIAEPAIYSVTKQTADSLVLEERKPEAHPTTGDSATAIYIARFLREE